MAGDAKIRRRVAPVILLTLAPGTVLVPRHRDRGSMEPEVEVETGFAHRLPSPPSDRDAPVRPFAPSPAPGQARPVRP